MNEYLGKIWTPNNQLLTRVKMLKVMSINDIVSKLNFVEQRVWLSVVGIVSVAMGKNRKKVYHDLSAMSYPFRHQVSTEKHASTLMPEIDRQFF